MTAWQLIVDPPASGRKNMQKDIQLFHDFEVGKMPSTLRIYSWESPCISLGYSQDADRIGVRDPSILLGASAGMEIVKRPTGGGIVYHNTAEVTYALVTAKDNPIFPKGLIPSYLKISEAVVCGLKMIGVECELGRRTLSASGGGPRTFCFSHP